MVSVIIVNYNTCSLTCNCIKSIIERTRNVSFEILVVDNASTDDSIQVIKDKFPEITLIENKTNVGFGSANNIAAEQANGEFLFFLNSDTILFENSIYKLVEFFKNKEQALNIGSLGCILVDDNKHFNGAGSQFPDCRTEADLMLRSLPLIGKLFNKTVPKPLPLDKEYFEIDYVIGADLMMKATVFNQLKGFDPAFFMYYEESDLQKRMHDRLGLKSFIFTNTQIIHLEDGSGKKNKKHNNKKRMMVLTSRNIYLKKHDFRNLNTYRRIEKLYCFLSKFNSKYTKSENREFTDAIKRSRL